MLVETFDLSLKKLFSGYVKVCGLFSCVGKSNTEANTPTQKMPQKSYARQKYPWRKLKHTHFEGIHFYTLVLTVVSAAYFMTHGCMQTPTRFKKRIKQKWTWLQGLRNLGLEYPDQLLWDKKSTYVRYHVPDSPCLLAIHISLKTKARYFSCVYYCSFAESL